MLVEYQNELKMNYLQLCDYLHQKYGKPSGDYFLTKTCKSPNQKIKRANEGLFIHHIKENTYIMLCNTSFAITQPFEYQEAQNLVYCNYLEHFILHLKIMQEYLTYESMLENKCKVGIGGILNYIVPEINDYFKGYPYQREWQIKAFEKVDKETFKELKEITLDFIEERLGFITNEEKMLAHLVLRKGRGKMLP